MKKTKNRLAACILTLVMALSLAAVPTAAEEEGNDAAVSESAAEVQETAEESEDAAVSTADKPEAGTIDTDSDWVSFLLICNEGMSDRGGNSGNTLMVMAMNQSTGQVRLAPVMWDTFMNYEGYDRPQRFDMAYRNNGPEEAVKVFNDNLGLDINLFMSLNYLSMATLIDAYGGVTVDVSRAERNALNGMVASKKENILASEDANLLTELTAEMLASDYYLNDFGEETHLNGMQAIGYGWLQYDSVYNCCQRDAKVIGQLFTSLMRTMSEEVVLYTEDYEAPEVTDGRRLINLDNLTEDDMDFLKTALAPVFDTSYNNLPEEETLKVALALARASWLASRQGVDITEKVEYEIFPLEATEPYEKIAGSEGHLIDYDANSQALKEFLYGS